MSISEVQFDVVPSSVTAYLMGYAEFHCIASCSGVFWLIDDQYPGANQDIETRSETGQREDGQPGQESTLWITATEQANNSVIECGVEERRTNFVIKANPVYLTVQGKHSK